MIHFEKVPEPADFEAEARRPGRIWLEENPPPKRPKDYWGPFKGKLADGFGSLCAYSAMYEPVGTVDHFVSCNEDRRLSYEWSNYRFASGWLNSSKSSLPANQILDPFEVQDGWFKLLLPSLQLDVDEKEVPPEFLERAQFVLKRLHLRDDERVVRQRREWHKLYEDGDITIAGLHRKAPLLARAIERDTRVHDEPS